MVVSPCDASRSVGWLAGGTQVLGAHKGKLGQTNQGQVRPDQSRASKATPIKGKLGQTNQRDVRPDQSREN